MELNFDDLVVSNSRVRVTWPVQKSSMRYAIDLPASKFPARAGARRLS